ncbi:hypothetical protein [Lonsdalea quercina]|uniref:hypothetical protein n=1 Tax=Lonsdalea quercina TaxID=71657 RepID=UPI003976182C
MSNKTMTQGVMQIHLSSWRYLALLTLPPLGIAFYDLSSSLSVLLLFLFFVAHYFCWRLYLDEQLFKLLDSESDLAAFDKAMSSLWLMKKTKTRTMTERWLGARRLFFRAVLTTLMLWGFALFQVLFLTQGFRTM